MGDFRLLFCAKGRVNRRLFWATLGSIAVLNALADAGALMMGWPYNVPALLVFVLSCWMVVIVSIKRAHDLGFGGRVLLIGLVPLVGNMFLLIALGFQRGSIGVNRFGLDPIYDGGGWGGSYAD